MVTSSEPCAVINITSISGLSCLMRVNSSIPVESASLRSVRTRSNGRCSSNSSASATALAVLTWWPQSPSINSSAPVTLLSSSTTRILPTSPIRPSSLQWQLDCYLSSLSRRTSHFHGTAVLLDNGGREKQPEPQTLTLCRVERLEHVFGLLFGHAATGIGYFNQEALIAGRGGDLQLAALAHCVD